MFQHPSNPFPASPGDCQCRFCHYEHYEKHVCCSSFYLPHVSLFLVRESRKTKKVEEAAKIEEEEEDRWRRGRMKIQMGDRWTERKASGGGAGRTSRERERQKEKWLTWNAVAVPLGPIRTPLWKRCNDASFSALYSCSDWWRRSSAELHHSITPFPLPPSTVDPDKGQEQRLCVGAAYYSEGWRTAKIRSPPSGPERPGDTVLIISLLLSCTPVFVRRSLQFIWISYFVSHEDKLYILYVIKLHKWHKIQPLFYFRCVMKGSWLCAAHNRYLLV